MVLGLKEKNSFSGPVYLKRGEKTSEKKAPHRGGSILEGTYSSRVPRSSPGLNRLFNLLHDPFWVREKEDLEEKLVRGKRHPDSKLDMFSPQVSTGEKLGETRRKKVTRERP